MALDFHKYLVVPGKKEWATHVDGQVCGHGYWMGQTKRCYTHVALLGGR
jgi:hypothetical protein